MPYRTLLFNPNVAQYLNRGRAIRVATGDPATYPLLPICGLIKGVDFGRSFGGDFVQQWPF
jgi:hypothetical protein